MIWYERFESKHQTYFRSPVSSTRGRPWLRHLLDLL